MEAKEQLVDTWRINARLNLYLLEAVSPEQLKTSLQKGKSVEGQFSHIHNVRLMWLKVSAPALWDQMQKLESPGLGHEVLKAGLEQSGEAIAELVSTSWDNGGKVKNFKPHVTGFVGYLIAHEANHRAHIELALRQAGTPLGDKVAYGMWEWGTR